MKIIKESDLYPHVKEYFEMQGYEVFHEVQVFSGGRVADIVAVRNKIVVVCEMKMNLNLSVLNQLDDWKGFAHYRYAAIPKKHSEITTSKNGNRYLTSTKNFHFANQIAKMLGIGILEVEGGGYAYDYIKPEFFRKAKVDYILRKCTQALNDYNNSNGILAGQVGGGYYTPYKQTIQNAKEYLETKGLEGASMREIIQNIETHYTGYHVDSCLGNAIKKFEMNTFNYREEGHRHIYFLRKFENNNDKR